MTRLVIAVPFDGDAALFQIVHDELCHARAKNGDAKKGELFLAWSDDTPNEFVPEAIGRDFHSRLDEIERQLSGLGPDIARANTDLSKWVTAWIASLRTGLLADRKLQEVLGIPVRQRVDAAQFEPELFRPEDHYERALAALRYSRNTLERIPESTTVLDEEGIRDLLLPGLNAVFEGAAAGEVFNNRGKTDILIRVEDRNVFIAECKISYDSGKFRKGLEQLLSYLAWRDDKAALLLFIRSGETSSIINKAIAVIKEHPNFIRMLNAAEIGERSDFVIHANGDPGREIRLAFLPFLLLDKP